MRNRNIPPKFPPSTSSSSGKDFENRLNTFGDIGFLLAQCTCWNRQNFKYCRCANFSPCHCKSKIPAQLRLSTQITTLNIFEPRQRFRKSVEYLWRYRIFAAQCTSWKWQNFKCFRCAKFSHCNCKSKQPAHLKLSTQMTTLNIFEPRQRFRKAVEYLWRYWIFSAQCTSWKWQNFKCFRCAKFSPCHCKSKQTAHLKLSTQMTTLNIFEPRQRFRKAVEYNWRCRIFAGTVYKLKVVNFQMLSMRKVFTFPLQK